MRYEPVLEFFPYFSDNSWGNLLASFHKITKQESDHLVLLRTVWKDTKKTNV
jgi:hypothetical protein